MDGNIPQPEIVHKMPLVQRAPLDGVEIASGPDQAHYLDQAHSLIRRTIVDSGRKMSWEGPQFWLVLHS